MSGTGTANPFELVSPRERRSDPSVQDHIYSRLQTTVRLIGHAVLPISRINNPVHADMGMDIVATQKATTGAQRHRSRAQTPGFVKRKHKHKLPAVATLRGPQSSVKTVRVTLSAQSPVL
jgi:hypothetical protein